MDTHMKFLVGRVPSCQIWQPDRGRETRALCLQMQAAVVLSTAWLGQAGALGFHTNTSSISDLILLPSPAEQDECLAGNLYIHSLWIL